MNIKIYFLITAILFALGAITHLMGLMNQSSTMEPMARSWIGLILSGCLSIWGFTLMAKTT